VSWLRRLADSLGRRSAPDDAEPGAATDPLEQLKRAAVLAAQYRSEKSAQTGNPVADMARGVYEPPRKRD
jgi:hypothetical protein